MKDLFYIMLVGSQTRTNLEHGQTRDIKDSSDTRVVGSQTHGGLRAMYGALIRLGEWGNVMTVGAPRVMFWLQI